MITTPAGTEVLLLEPINTETNRVLVQYFIPSTNRIGDAEVNVTDLVATGGVEEILAASEALKPLIYDQPALPTKEDLQRVLKMDYPTVYTRDGLGCVTNAGMMQAFFSTLATIETMKERASGNS